MTQIVTRRLGVDDAPALAGFYNGLSARSIRTFRPLGTATDLDTCRGIARDNAPGGSRHDRIAFAEGRVVGWSFLWELEGGQPVFGLGIADAWHGQGLGARLMDEIMGVARDLGLPLVVLTVVTDNERAWRMYERRGFVRQEQFVEPGDGETYYRMRWTPG